MIILIRLFIFAVLLAGCTPDKDRTSLPGARNAASDYIARADISVSSATVETPLKVQYTAINTEGKKIFFRFRWFVDGRVVQEGDSHVLEQGLYPKNSRVEIEVIPVVDTIEAKGYITKAITILNTLPVVTAVELSPIPAFPDSAITALVHGTDADKDDSVVYTYEWEVDGKRMPPSESNSLSTTGIKKKSVIAVMVTPFDGQDKGKPVRSRIVLGLSNRNPEITSIPPSGLENGIFMYQVTAKDADGDPLVYTVLNGPEGLTIDKSTGLIRWEPPRQITQSKEVVVKISADDGDGGIAFQEFSLFLEKK